MRTKNTMQGFTLIETMVYLTLFSIIMTGAVVSAYQIMESTQRNQTHSLLETEGDFLVSKITWAISGTQSISAPGFPTGGVACAESDTLSAVKWSAAIGTVTTNLSGGEMLFSRGGNPSQPLNNSNTIVSNLLFAHCYTGSDNPESISASFTLSARTPGGAMIARDFSTKVYLRK